jgi:hypothetical protein
VAKDVYHDIVRTALERDGWTITHDPYVLRLGERRLYTDLGAEAPIGAERAGEKIAVEVKSFLGPSEMTDLERALGQLVLYSYLIGRQEPDRKLYLAMTDIAFGRIFNDLASRELLDTQKLPLIIVHPEPPEIVRWIN